MNLLGNVGRGLMSGRPLDYEELDENRESGTSPALPPLCLRSLQSPRPECGINCPGQQRDGACLADLVREATTRGITPTFAVAPDGVWEPQWAQ